MSSAQDIANKIVANSLPNPLGSRLLLEAGEEIKAIYTGLVVIDDKNFCRGPFIVTNKRLKFVQEMSSDPLFRESFEVDLELLEGLTIESGLYLQNEIFNAIGIRRLGRVIILALLLTQYSNYPLDALVLAIQMLKRAKENWASQIKVVNITLDFAYIRKLMGNGGIVVQSIKCPQCGAPLEVPQIGSTTHCKFCGASVVAQDVLDKIKQMIS